MLKRTLNLSRAVQNVNRAVRVSSSSPYRMTKSKGHSAKDRVLGKQKEESAAIFTTNNEPEKLNLLVNIKPGAKKNALTGKS